MEGFGSESVGNVDVYGLYDIPYDSRALDTSSDASVVLVGNYFEYTSDYYRRTAGGVMEPLLEGLNARADAISGDGSVVVGGSLINVSGSEAFRWTSAGGAVGLGDLPGGDFYSAATAVSADGSVVGGDSTGVSGIEGFLWTQAGGMVGIGI